MNKSDNPNTDIQAGTTSISGTGAQTQTRSVTRVNIHPDYNDVTSNNDVAVLKLDSPLTLDESTVQPACLPETTFTPDKTGVVAFVSGWGNTLACPPCPVLPNECDDHESSQDLRFVKVPLLTNENCAVGTTDTCPLDGYLPEALTPNMVCAGFLEDRGIDSCQGDSGGPLVVPASTEDDSAVVFGVVSFGIGCAEPNFPGVYARVTQYVDWITSFLLKCPGNQLANEANDACVCPVAGQVVGANDNCVCPEGSKLNTGKDACEETFFWVITVTAFNFPDDGSLNTNIKKDNVAAELQTPICGGTAANTGCTVIVLTFTKGSTNINGQTTHTAGQNIQRNVQSNVVTAGVTFSDLGNNPATSSSVSMTNFAHCTEDSKCKVDEGDCDDHTDCMVVDGVQLQCGINNCPAGFDPLADCCYNPATSEQNCNGGSSNMWTCCKDKTSGCSEGEGDCDNDDECAGGLVCGRNSCDTAFNNNFKNSKKFFPSGQADCCISRKRALFYGIPSRSDLEENFQNDEEPF